MQKIENYNCYSLFLFLVTAVVSRSSCEGANTWSGSKHRARKSLRPVPGGHTVAISPHPP